jgi:hypothetical protein
MYRWKNHWLRSRSVGDGSATIRATRGFRYCATRLMVPPFPAASRPSKTTTTRCCSALTHSWTLASSTCNRYSSASYALEVSDDRLDRALLRLPMSGG